MQPNSASSLSRPDSLGSEGLEAQKSAQSQQLLDQEKKAMNNVWNSFLAPESSNVSFTRLDTPSSETAKQPTFAEIFAQMKNEQNDEVKKQDSEQVGMTSEEVYKDLDKTGTNEVKEVQPDQVAAPVVEEKTETRMAGTISFTDKKEKVDLKTQALGTSKEVLQNTIKISKFGYKEGKDVVNAVSDLWKNFIGFREKKADPKAKENAEKAAKRKANKLRFIGLLKEGMSLYYAGMRKALMELEVKLGVNSMGAEDRNRFLGRNRNLSYQGNDSIYAIHQTAFEMAEQKRRQQQSQSSDSKSGGRSAGAIFRDKNMQGERSGGQNMMSAVG